MTPEFAEAVAPVVRWAKEQDWSWSFSGVIRDRFGNSTGLSLDRSPHDGGTIYEVRAPSLAWWEPPTAQVAIDVLAALGVLPMFLSSLYQKGVDDGEWVATPHKATAAAVLLPDLEPVPEHVDGYPIGQRSHA